MLLQGKKIRFDNEEKTGTRLFPLRGESAEAVGVLVAGIE
jgi:hypothetical protein